MLACVQLPPPLRKKNGDFLRGGGGCTQAREMLAGKIPGLPATLHYPNAWNEQLRESFLCLTE